MVMLLTQVALLPGAASPFRLVKSVVLVGGHSIDDAELKYGLSVTGTVHPEKLVTNSGAKPGDRIILTKPLGTGIINTAAKAEMAPAEIITNRSL